MQRVVDAQRAYDRATATAGTTSQECTTAKERWQKLDQDHLCDRP
jgi:hypothetical protein